MVIAKLLIDAGKGIVLERIVGKLSGIYDKFRAGEHDNSVKIDDYELKGGNYFSSGSVREVANRYGLENLLDGYKKSVFERINGYIAELKSLTDYIKNSAANPASSHTLYVTVYRAYENMCKLLGYSPSEEIKKAVNYASDLVNQYLQRVGDLNARLDKFLSLASVFSADGSNLLEAASRRAVKWVAYKVLESKGIPVGSLEKALSTAAKPFAEARKKAKPLFVEYGSLAKNWNLAYSDFRSGVYGEV